MFSEEIEQNLKMTLKQMNEEFDSIDIPSARDFAFRLGKYYYEIIYLHPFREGNGRSIRSFLRDFVVQKSKNKSCGPLDLDYTKLDKNNLILGTALRYIYPSYVEMEFVKGLVPYIKNDEKKR
ncbi:MAG: Fic family protein [Bacilli bacterium]|nr:Fic family protein [Bacilli bacterium]